MIRTSSAGRARRVRANSTLSAGRSGLQALGLGLTAALFSGCARGTSSGAGTEPAPVAPVARSAAPFDVELAGAAATIRMMPIPAGTLEVTDPAAGGPRSVAVGPLWMSQTEVPWDLFDVYVYRLDEADPAEAAGADAISRPSKPYLPPDRGFGHAGYPAISIAHDSAAQFCAWLSAKTGGHFRLATEAEWEFACRGGGADEAPIGDRAWHAGNAGNKSHPVGEKLPNAYGLHDMLGNVVEWTEGLDGKPVTRGGGFMDAPEALNCQTRTPYNRTWQSRDPQIPKSTWWLSDGPFVGFRIVCDQPPPPAARPSGSPE
jgi:formylglycine-generating enzyme required for sulfatase activity